jgi:CheY-like chemotaxis protein
VDEVVCVENTTEAVEAATIRAVQMDVRIRGLNGLDAAHCMRALTGARRQVAIIALTARVFAKQVEKCRRACIDCDLTKAFVQHALLDAFACPERS